MPLDALALLAAVRAVPRRSPVARLEAIRLPDWERQGTHWRVPALEPRPDPAVRRRRGASSRRARRRRDGTELDGFVQVGVAKEDQPHYLKVIARPDADASALVGFGLGVIAARTAKGGDRATEHGVIAPVRTYESPIDRRLEDAGFDFDRQRHAADEGNPCPRRRTGSRAGRRAVSVG